MTSALHRLSRNVCRPSDRPWIDAMFAEAEVIEPGVSRLLWLLGAAGFLGSRYLKRAIALVSPGTVACFVAMGTSGFLALIEFEGFLPEDDWYGPLAALSVLGLGVTGWLNWRRRSEVIGL